MGLPLLMRMAWRNLWRNGRRTALTLVSIAFGLFLAVLMTAMQDRNWADMIDLAARLGGGHVTVQHKEFLDAPALDKTVQGTDSILARALRERWVERGVVRIVGQTLLSTASSSRGAVFVAVDPAREDSTTFALMSAFVEGSLFASADDPGIVLGERLAENLGVTLGKKVVFNMSDKNGDIVAGLARVRGIVRTGAPSVDGGLCVLPLNTLRELLGYAPDEATQVALFIGDQRRSDQVAERIAAVLTGIGAADTSNGAPSPGTLRDTAGSTAVRDTAVAVPWHESQPELAGFIAMKVGGANFMKILIAVLIAAGIFNTLFVSVTERMREFGIMLAIGYGARDIHALVMLESLWLGLVGLVVGVLLTSGPYLWLNAHGIDMTAMIGEGNVELAGIAVSPIFKVEIFPGNAVFIAVAALVATLAAGIYPAWKAGRVAPVETIRLV